MSDEVIKLGDKVRDKITGFEGTVMAKIVYIHGCTQFQVQPPAREGEQKKHDWIDEPQLEIITDNGGDVPPPTHGGIRSHP